MFRPGNRNGASRGPDAPHLPAYLMGLIQTFQSGTGDASEPGEPLGAVSSTLTLKDDPMFDANANLIFFSYIVIVVGLCPICERLANRFSK